MKKKAGDVSTSDNCQCQIVLFRILVQRDFASLMRMIHYEFVWLSNDNSPIFFLLFTICDTNKFHANEEITLSHKLKRKKTAIKKHQS